jgi:hypothetical protein
LAFVGAGELMKVLHPLAIWTLVVVAMGAAPWPLRRSRAATSIVTGWQTGLGVTLVLAAAAAGQVLLR